MNYGYGNKNALGARWHHSNESKLKMSKSKLGDKNPIQSFSKYPKLRFDLNNGITLCRECHSLTYNYKGRAKRK